MKGSAKHAAFHFLCGSEAAHSPALQNIKIHLDFWWSQVYSRIMVVKSEVIQWPQKWVDQQIIRSLIK